MDVDEWDTLGESVAAHRSTNQMDGDSRTMSRSPGHPLLTIADLPAKTATQPTVRLACIHDPRNGVSVANSQISTTVGKLTSAICGGRIASVANAQVPPRLLETNKNVVGASIERYEVERAF